MQTSRRHFIQLTVGTGIGLSLGFQLSGCNSTSTNHTASFSPNAWLSIYPDNSVVINISKAEIGQGIITAIPLIIAEELELNWSDIKVQLAKTSESFTSMRASGSRSIQELWQPLRTAAASAKYMLLEAATIHWQTKLESCVAENGYILNKTNGKKISYGDLSLLAKTQDIPTKPQLKSPEKFKFIGIGKSRINIRDIVLGKATYGMDTNPSKTIYAAIKHAPVFGSKLLSFQETTPRPKTVKGIIELSNAIAVVADTYWIAQKTLLSLDISWSSSDNESLNSVKIKKDFEQAIQSSGKLLKQAGSSSDKAEIKAISKNVESISANYTCSYQAHVTMEPMNCTVHFHDDGCDIWVPTQNPQLALSKARKIVQNKVEFFGSKILRKLGVSDNINVYPTLVGGGFGRRLEQDYIEEALMIGRHFNNPVKLIWSREEDIQHDFYRPYSIHKLSSSIDLEKTNTAMIKNLEHHAAGASEGKITWGAIDFPYQIPDRKLYFSKIDHGIPIGSWRSVSYSNHVFATESFIDEIANKLGHDSLALRLSLLKHNKRSRSVLEHLSKLSNYQAKKERKLGVAFNYGFGSFIGIAIELSKSPHGLSIKEIYCVADCGIIVDPNNLKAQIEGGIIFGLDAAIAHSITIENGRVSESNFDSYPLSRINDIPKITIQLIKNNEEPGGAGEISVPIVAPAVANAIYLETGLRYRSIPFDLKRT